ncbi:MAG: hypothetical protein UX77_C0018G0001, partial [Parcubacteria group bacterium GW2011_GWA1_47_11]
MLIGGVCQATNPNNKGPGTYSSSDVCEQARLAASFGATDTPALAPIPPDCSRECAEPFDAQACIRCRSQGASVITPTQAPSWQTCGTNFGCYLNWGLSLLPPPTIVPPVTITHTPTVPQPAIPPLTASGVRYRFDEQTGRCVGIFGSGGLTLEECNAQRAEFQPTGGTPPPGRTPLEQCLASAGTEAARRQNCYDRFAPAPAATDTVSPTPSPVPEPTGYCFGGACAGSSGLNCWGSNSSCPSGTVCAPAFLGVQCIPQPTAPSLASFDVSSGRPCGGYGQIVCSQCNSGDGANDPTYTIGSQRYCAGVSSTTTPGASSAGGARNRGAVCDQDSDCASGRCVNSAGVMVCGFSLLPPGSACASGDGQSNSCSLCPYGTDSSGIRCLSQETPVSSVPPTESITPIAVSTRSREQCRRECGDLGGAEYGICLADCMEQPSPSITPVAPRPAGPPCYDGKPPGDCSKLGTYTWGICTYDSRTNSSYYVPDNTDTCESYRQREGIDELAERDCNLVPEAEREACRKDNNVVACLNTSEQGCAGAGYNQCTSLGGAPLRCACNGIFRWPVLVEDTEGYCAAQRVIADAPKGDRCGHDGETIFVEGDRAIAEESRCTPGTTCAPIAVNDAGNITEVACLPVDLIGEHQYEGSQFRCDLATHTIIDVEKGTEVRTLAWNETCRRVVTGDGQPVWIVNTLSEEELAELEASGLPVFSVSHDDASCLPNGNMRQEARTLLPPQGFTCVQVGDRVSFEPIGGPDAGRNGCVDDDGNTRNPYSSLHEGNSVRVCVPSLVDGHVIGYDWQTGTPNTCGLRAAGESWIDGTSCKTCIASGYIASQQLFTYTSFGRFVAPACGGFATTRTDESGRVIQEVVPDDFPGGHLPGFAYCDNHGQCQVIPPGTDSPQPVQTIGATSAYALRCPYNCAVAGSHSGERADGTTNRILDSRKECSFDGTSVVSYNIFGTRTGTRLCDSGICSAGACVPGAQVIDADTGNTLVCGVGQTCDVFDPWTGERVEQTVIAVTEGQDVRYEARSNYASEDLAQASRETQEQYVRENFHENYYEAFLASGQSFDEFQREQREAWERIQATIINLGVVDEAYMERVQSGEYVPTQLEATLTEQRGNVLAAGVLFFNDFTHGATRQGNELLLTNRERCRQKGLVQCWFDGDAAEFLRGGVMQGAAPAAFVAAIVAIPLGAPFIAAALPAGAVSAGTVATTSLLYGSTAFGAYSAVNSLQQTAQLCDGNHPGTILNQSSCPGAVVNSAVQFATLFGGAAAGQQMLEGRILVEAGTSARGAQLLTNAESAVNTGAQAAQSFRVARDLNIAISAGTTLYFGGLAYNSCINGTTDERGNRYVDAASCGTNIGMAVLSAARTGLAVAMPSNAQAAFRANLTADAGDVTVNGFQMALACSSGDINACSQAIGGTVASVGGLGVNFADTPGVPRPLRDTPIAQFETARANLETFYEHPPNQPDQWQLRSFVRPDDPALRVAEMRLRETIVARAQEQAAINLALRDITIPEREQTGAVRLLIDAQQEFARAKAAYEALADRTLTERLTSAEFAAYQQAIEQVTRARAEVDLEQQALRSPRSILEQLIDRLRTPAELAAYEEVREAFFEIARDADADTQSPAYQKALNDLIAARHNLEAVGYTVDQRDIDRELGSMQEQFQQVRDELARLEQEIPLRENYDAAAGAVQKIEAELAALRSRRDVLSADAASASERRILDRRIEAFTISLDRAKEIASFAERVRNNDPRTRAELDDLHARRNQLQTEFLQIQNQDTYLTRGRAEAGTLLGRLRSLFGISQPSLQTLERVRSGQQAKPKPLGEQIADLFRPGEREVSEAEAIVLGMEQSGKKTFASAAERQAEIVRIEQELSSFRSAELYARGLSEDRIGAILRAVGGEEFVSIEHLALRIGEVTDLTSLPALRAYAEEVWMRRNAGTDPRAQARVARNVYGDIEPTAARIVGEELARRIRESNTEINRNRQRSAQARQTRARAAVEGIVDGLFAADGRFIRGIRTNLLDAISSHDSLARYSPEARGVIAERIVRDTEIQFDKNSVARRLTEAITIRAQGVQFRSPNVVDLFAGAGSRQLLADANAMGRYQSYLARTPARIPIPAPIRAAVNAVERTVVNPLMRLGYRLTNGLNELFGGAARSRRTDRPVTLAPEAERLVTALAGYDGELFGSEGILTVRRDRDGFTQFARTDAGQRMLSDSDIGLLNETVKLYEQWQRSQDPAFQQIRALTGDYRDQAKFVIEAVRAFGRKGSRGAVLGALPGVGKTDVIMVLNLIVQTKMTSDAQIVLFPDRTIMQQFLRVDESGTSTLRTFLEEQFGPGSVLVLQSGQAPSPDAVNAARIIVSTRDIAFPLRETDTPGGRALRTKWGQSYIHGDEGHWTLSPHESYLSTYGESQRILETDEGRAYQEVISRLTGDDGPTTLLRLIDERARGQTPDGVRRAQDGRSGLYDADTERAILAEWLGERNTAGQLPDELKPLIGETDLAAIQDGLNAYLDSHFDDIALILARDLTVINRMADLLAGVPGGDYGQDGGVIAPREQNKITGRRYQSIAEQLLYNTVGAQIMQATGIDLSELTISPHSRDINFAMLMYEAKGFAIYTGTPEPIARIFRQAYGIDLVQIGDSAFTMVKARLEQGITDGTTRIFLNEADAQRARPSGRNDVWLNGDNRVANDVALARVTAEYADGTILFIVGANGEFVEGTVRTGKFVANTDQ